MDKREFENNQALQFRLTELVAQAVRNINTDPALTPEARAEAIKELGGAPKHLLFEYLNASFKTGPEIAKAVKDLISHDRPRGATKKSTPEKVLDKVKRINKRK